MKQMNGYRKLELKELQSIMLETIKKIHGFCQENDIKYYIIGGTLLGAIRHKGFIPWDDDIDIAMCRDDYEKFRNLFIQTNSFPDLFLQDYQTDKDFGLSLMRVCIKGTFLDWPAQNHLRNCKNVYIDIFPLDNVPLNKKQQEKQARNIRIINKLCNIKLYKVVKSSNLVKYFIKLAAHVLLKLVPITSLVNARNEVMKKYNKTKGGTNVCSMQSHYSYNKQNMNYQIYGTPALYRFEDIELYGPNDYDAYLRQLFGDYMKIPNEDKRPKPLDTYIKEV